SKQAAETRFQQPACLQAPLQNVAGISPEGHAGRESVPPEAHGRKAERACRVVARLQFQDEEQPVDRDEPLVPELLGKSSPVGVGVEPVSILGMVQNFLNE